MIPRAEVLWSSRWVVRVLRASRWLADSLAAQRDRWVLWIPVLIGSGVASYFALDFEPVLWVGPTVAFAGIAAALLMRRRHGFMLAFLGLTAVALGFAAAQVRSAWVAAPVLHGNYGPASVGGRVVRVENLPGQPRVLLDQVRLDQIPEARTPERVRIRLQPGPTTLQVGDRISVRARLSPPPAPASPGAYDFQRRAWFERIGAVGFALGAVRKQSEGSEKGGFRLAVSQLRYAVGDRIRAALPEESGAVAAALIIGDRSAIPADVTAAMRDSGLAHLLAISGLHMGLVASILFFSVRLLLAGIEPIALRYPIKKCAAAVALVGGFAYLLLSGGTVPTQRAYIMTGLVLMAVLLDRTAISLRLVGFAAAIILLLTPESLTGASFQLSFAAVVALVAVYEGMRERIQDWRASGGLVRKTTLYFFAVGLSTLVAGTATGLIALHHFGRIVHYDLIGNMLAIPITGFWIMPWGIAGCLLMPFGGERFPLMQMGAGIDLVLWIARSVSALPGAVTTVPAMPTNGLLVLAVGGLWLCLWQGRVRWLGVPLIGVSMLSILLAGRPDILVSGTGNLMAIRLPDGELSLSTNRAERFTAGIWLERNGQMEAETWPLSDAPTETLSCDTIGCTYRRDRFTVALVRSGLALEEDCRQADIVVSAVPVRHRCPSAQLVIDRFDLWRHGTHTIDLVNGDIRVRSVGGHRGDRPWVWRPDRTAEN